MCHLINVKNIELSNICIMKLRQFINLVDRYRYYYFDMIRLVGWGT